MNHTAIMILYQFYYKNKYEEKDTQKGTLRYFKDLPSAEVFNPRFLPNLEAYKLGSAGSCAIPTVICSVFGKMFSKKTRW
jgi:hypothetical protein